MPDATPFLGYLSETPSQTAGPYVHIGLIPRQAGFDIFENNLGDAMVGPETRGERFRGWGRTGTDFQTGLWAFETVKPGPVEGRRGHKPMAPHLNLWIVARGINLGLATRMYFGDEAAANAA